MPQPADQTGTVVLRPLAAADNPGEYPHGNQKQSRTGEESQLRQGQNGGQGIAEQDDGLEHNKSQPFCRGADHMVHKGLGVLATHDRLYPDPVALHALFQGLVIDAHTEV